MSLRVTTDGRSDGSKTKSEALAYSDAGAYSWIAGEVSTPVTLTSFCTVMGSPSHSSLQVRGIKRFHQDAVAFGDGQVRQEANTSGEQSRKYDRDRGSFR